MLIMVWFARPVAGHYGIQLEAGASGWTIDGPVGRREGDWAYQPPSFVLEGNARAAAEFAAAEYLDCARRLAAGEEVGEDIRLEGGNHSPETLTALAAELDREGLEFTTEE